MKVRKNSNFWTLTRRANAGFTLVELIVVIAILAILAGVGIPVYSGYITKANITADKTLVADVLRAAEITYYTENDTVTPGTVILYSDGTPAKASAAWLQDAMTNAFGADWENKLQLKYGNWGSGAAVSQEVLSYFSGVVNKTNPSYADQYLAGVYSGQVTPSFADDVDELFVTLRDTADGVGGKMDKTGGELVQGAASVTTDADLFEFVDAWKGDAWNSKFFMGDDSDKYGEGVSGEDQQVVEKAIANAAVIKARNTALACYMSQQGFPEVYNAIANYTYGGNVPRDAFGDWKNGTNNYEFANKLVSIIYGNVPVDNDNRDTVIATDRKKYNDFDAAMTAYTAGGMNSPAANDAAAYFAMMDTVMNVNTENTAKDTYFDQMAGAVSLYGAIARGEISLVEMNEMYAQLGDLAGADNAIAITFIPGDNGLDIKVNPSTANLE